VCGKLQENHCPKPARPSPPPPCAAPPCCYLAPVAVHLPAHCHLTLMSISSCSLSNTHPFHKPLRPHCLWEPLMAAPSAAVSAAQHSAQGSSTPTAPHQQGGEIKLRCRQALVSCTSIRSRLGWLASCAVSWPAAGEGLTGPGPGSRRRQERAGEGCASAISPGTDRSQGRQGSPRALGHRCPAGTARSA